MPGVTHPETIMNTGKTLFAQLMDFLPWTTFTRIVDRHGGDRYVKSLTCADQFRVMAFAQLTYRESLRDIEVCLSAQVAKLYHMGFRQEIKRSTLADANEARDWRIHAEFAQRLIVQARKLYAGDSFGIELENTTYALDSTTIDLCLSLFPWALFRTTKSAVKMHTLLDLRGNIPSFIHISDGKLGDVNVLDILVLEPGAIYVMDRGYLDFARLYVVHQAQAFFVTRAKSNTQLRRVYSAPVDRGTGILCDQTIALTGTTNRVEIISPGYLPDNLTVENIRAGNSNIRNPILVSYVAKGLLPYHGLGSGIKRALEKWPEIGFLDDRDGCLFTATVHRTAAARSVESSVESSGKTRDQILDLLAARADMTIVQVAQVLGLSTRAIEKQVGKLQQEGLLRRVGPRKSGRWEVLRGGG